MQRFDKVPWSCKEEWEYCRNQLFNDDLKMQQKALQHLYVWKIRNINLPIAVECTLILMEVKLGDNQPNTASAHTLTAGMTSWYSTAIMRFLNLVIDSNPGIKTSSSMMDLAKQVGIPEWIVQLRHNAAHGHSLPSLSRLKEATNICLKWLHTNYWLKGLNDDSQKSDISDDLVSASFKSFQACKILKKYILRGNVVMAELSDDDRKLPCSIMPDKIREEKENSLDTWKLVDVYEIALKKLFRRLMEDSKRIEDLVDHLINSDQSFMSTNHVKNNKIRKSVMREWVDVLSIICNSSSGFFLLKRLCQTIVSELEDFSRRDCAAAYVNEVLESISTYQQNESFENVKFKKRKPKRLRLDLNLTKNNLVISNISMNDEEILELMNIISKSPNRYSGTILKKLINVSESYQRSSVCEKLTQLISIYNGRNNLESSSSPATDEIHTLQELLGNKYQPSSCESPLSKVETRDSTDGESAWSQVPLGFLPWQKEFQFWLQIYDSDDEVDETGES